MLNRIAVLLAIAVCSLLPLSPSTYADGPELVQLMCPVMPEQAVDPDLSVEFEGRTVYLCCQKCRQLFETTPEKYADAIVLTTVSDTWGDNTDTKIAGRGGGAGYETTSYDKDVLHKIGDMHPIVVHFPVALLITAALARCLAVLGAVPWAGSAVRFCVWIGGAGALVAATLGWFGAGAPAEAEALGDLVFNHRWLGVATALLSVILIVLVEREARKADEKSTKLTTFALIGVAILVGVTGHYGGMLTHGVDYLPW